MIIIKLKKNTWNHISINPKKEFLKPYNCVQIILIIR